MRSFGTHIINANIYIGLLIVKLSSRYLIIKCFFFFFFIL